ncbi:MAG TPA: GNAT family N-acetyltransferase [Streptosporangiaceae bacterium]
MAAGPRPGHVLRSRTPRLRPVLRDAASPPRHPRPHRRDSHQPRQSQPHRPHQPHEPRQIHRTRQPHPVRHTTSPKAPSGEVVGYLLATSHPAFHANGLVAWVEEVMVAEPARGTGVGRQLMAAAEARARRRGARYVALATRRAAPFYQALGYEDSAVYFKKPLT